jgi:hypothetical protein
MRITSILSLAGVLSAGSAAAAVNSQVLTNTDSANANAAVTAGATLTESATQVYSRVLTASQVMFQVGDAGLVTLDTADNVLTVVSASASPGWQIVDSVEGQLDGSADVELTFQSAADDVVEFTADLLADGTVTTTVESEDSSGVLDANGTADDEGTAGTGNRGNGNGGNGTDGDSGVLDSNGTADDDADDCSGEFITVCVDADAEADVEVNDD